MDQIEKNVDNEAAYLKRTPIRRGDRHATSQDLVKISGLMISLKLSWMADGSVTSRQAPVAERLRTMQSMAGALENEIEPPLKVRCRCNFRLSSLMAALAKKGSGR